MNNSLDTLDTCQQIVSHLTAFSEVTKAPSEDQHPESKQALDQRPEDNRGDSTSTFDSSEARDLIAHKNDSGLEAPAKPPSKCPKKGRGNNPL